MDYYLVNEHPSIEDAPKDICIDGQPYTGGRDQITKWALAVALHSFELGQEISEEELALAVRDAMCQQTLDGLVEKGLIEALWSEEKNDIVYRAKE
jgi:hypothetical protein